MAAAAQSQAVALSGAEDAAQAVTQSAAAADESGSVLPPETELPLTMTLVAEVAVAERVVDAPTTSIGASMETPTNGA